MVFIHNNKYNLEELETETINGHTDTFRNLYTINSSTGDGLLDSKTTTPFCLKYFKKVIDNIPWYSFFNKIVLLLSIEAGLPPSWKVLEFKSYP